MSRIICSNIFPAHPLCELRDRISPLRSQQQVNVIGHQYIRMNPAPKPVAALEQKLSVKPPVPIIPEDRPSIIAALQMVNGYTRKEYARHARHIQIGCEKSSNEYRRLHSTFVVALPGQAGRQYDVADDDHCHQSVRRGTEMTRTFNDSDPLNTP